MKYLFYTIILNLAFISNLSTEEKKCKDLVDKPIEWSKCVKDKSIDLGKKSIDLGKEKSKKLNTDSKLTDWVKKKLGK